MKGILLNIIFMVLGIIVLLFQCLYKFEGTLGWILGTFGIILITAGLFYEAKKSKGSLIALILELLF